MHRSGGGGIMLQGRRTTGGDALALKERGEGAIRWHGCHTTGVTAHTLRRKRSRVEGIGATQQTQRERARRNGKECEEEAPSFCGDGCRRSQMELGRGEGWYTYSFFFFPVCDDCCREHRHTSHISLPRPPPLMTGDTSAWRRGLVPPHTLSGEAGHLH